MNTVTRMRDAGRSWTEIAQRAGRSVNELKAEVRADKLKRREDLARTIVNERARGLLDECQFAPFFGLTCRHARKLHTDSGCPLCEADGGHCSGFVQEYRDNESLQPQQPQGRRKRDVSSELWYELQKKYTLVDAGARYRHLQRPEAWQRRVRIEAFPAAHKAAARALRKLRRKNSTA